MKGVTTILFLAVFLTTSFDSLSQDTTQAVEKDKYESVTEDIDYSNTKNALRVRKRTPKKKKASKKGPSLNFNGLGNVLNIISYALIIVLILAIVYVLFSQIKIAKSVDPEEAINEGLEEHHIDDLDLDNAISRALDEGNYRLAIRFHFLQILQELSLKEEIDWKFEKTNRDYADELVGTYKYTPFKRLVHIFDWVWYGNEVINQEEYAALTPHFTSFKNIAE